MKRQWGWLVEEESAYQHWALEKKTDPGGMNSTEAADGGLTIWHWQHVVFSWHTLGLLVPTIMV